jgi:YidC/Oxa1 family membrane protein insertase
VRRFICYLEKDTMETRKMITAMLVAIAVFYAWLLIANRIWPQQRATTQPGQPTSAAAEQSPTTQPQVVTGGGATTRLALPPIILGSAVKDGPFPMEVELQPRGADVSQVRMRSQEAYLYDTVDKKAPYVIIKPVEWSDPRAEVWRARSFATHLQFVNPKLEVALEDDLWQVESKTDQEVVFRTDVLADDKPLARVFKTYTLHPQTPQSRTSDLQMSLKIQSLTDQALEVIVIQQGPIGFRREELRSEDRKIIGARWTGGKLVNKRCTRSDVLKKKSNGQQAGKEGGPAPIASQGVIVLGRDDEEGNRIAWLAGGNKYFGCIMAPTGRVDGNCQALFERAEAFHFNNTPDDMEQPEQRQDLALRWITKPVDIAKGGTAELGFDLYIGPKSKRIFEDVPTYAHRQYYQALSGEYPFCTPAPLVGLMMVLLNGVHAAWPHNYGIAIILLVLLVKLILHPISKKSQVNMQKMAKNQAKLKPRIEALKEKYGNDRAKLNQATMELYKEEGVNPAGQMLNCLPMMLQIPIWVALYTALAYTIEMRHAPFDGWWIRDLTRPDEFMKLFDEPKAIPLLGYLMGGPLQYLNLLPILLGVFQVLQTKFMPRSTVSQQPSPSGGPDQLEQQRKMMMFMSVFFVFILYNAPSGLTLYIMVNNLLSIVEQWQVRKHLAELEARGEDAAKEVGWFHKLFGRSESPDRQNASELPRPKSWLQRKWGELQREVEEAKRVQSQKKKDKR